MPYPQHSCRHSLRLRKSTVVLLLALISAAISTTISGTVSAQSAVPRNDTRLKLLDSVAAIVGSDTITQRELATEVRKTMQNIRQQGSEPPPREVIVTQVLENLIMKKLQLREARKLGITLDELALDRVMENIARKNRITIEELRQRTEESGLPYAELREEMRVRNIIQRLIQEAVVNRITVTEEEIDAELAKREQDSTLEYRFAHVIVPGKSKELRRARKLLDKNIGPSPTRFAKRFNRYWAKAGGGKPHRIKDFAWRTASDLPKELQAQIGDMLPGSFSSVFYKKRATHLFVLLDTRGDLPGTTKTVYRVRHILMQPNVLESDDTIIRKMKRMRDDIESGKKRFGDLARRYSKDYGSAIKGGILNWTSPQELVPEFAEAMRNTPNGEMAGPFSTAYGWHLLQVLDKKEVATNMDEVRNEAETAVRKNLANKEIQQWLVNLRNNRHVEVLLGKNT